MSGNGDSDRFEEVDPDAEEETFTAPSYEPPVVGDQPDSKEMVTLFNHGKQDIPILLLNDKGVEYQTKIPARGGKVGPIPRASCTPQIESLRANKLIRVEP